MGLEDYDDPRRVEARRLFELERARAGASAAVAETSGPGAPGPEEFRMGDHEVTEAQLNESVARAFHRVPSSSAEYFRRAGFCEEDAARGASLLESGRYFSFTDVAMSMGIFDGAEFRRRNPDVTPERITEAAKQAKDAGLAGGASPISEAELDALDDAVWGKPGERRR